MLTGILSHILSNTKFDMKYNTISNGKMGAEFLIEGYDFNQSLGVYNAPIDCALLIKLNFFCA